MIKILIGGSPCTYWSIAQTKHREKKAEGMGWELFRNYLIAKEKFKPDFFLYENNVSAAEEIKQMIRECLDVDDGTLFGEGKPNRYIEINSALVSAQNRQRFYVHNCGDVRQPKDRHIMLKDILETGKGVCCSVENKSRTLRASYYKSAIANNVDSAHYPETAVAEHVCLRRERDEIGKKLRKKYELGEIHFGFNEHRNLQPRHDGKTNTLTSVEKDNIIAERVPDYGRPDKSRPVTAHYGSKADTETSIQQNSFSDNPNKQVFDYVAEEIKERKNSHIEISDNNIRRAQDKNNATCAESVIRYNFYEKGDTLISARPTRILESDFNARSNRPIYEVKDGHITINGKQYPIKLKDGNYIIRKLTVTECCRLQTMPDHYCDMVSKSQAYKALGNGWTAEVIIHILKHALDKKRRDEKIVVLSMYDGIATGRYCLDRMGFMNVEYYAFEIDKFAIKVAKTNYPDIIECGDAFQVRDEDFDLGKWRKK